MAAYVPPKVEAARKRSAQWYQDNREKAILAAKQRYEVQKKDPAWRLKMNVKQRDKIRGLRWLVISHYGTKCACCQEDQREFLTLDHICGGGTKHRKSVSGKSGTSVYSYWNWFIKNDFPPGYQTLCMNCNFAKGCNGMCPHRSLEVN